MPDAFPFACVVLPGDADAATIAATAGRASEAGARPVIVPLPPDAPRPSGVQVVTVSTGLAGISQLRRAMAALANSPAVGLILWNAASEPSLPRALAVVDAARRTTAPIVVPDGRGADDAPVWYARETWLELMTVAEQGLDAVHARYGDRVAHIEVSDAVA